MDTPSQIVIPPTYDPVLRPYAVPVRAVSQRPGHTYLTVAAVNLLERKGVGLYPGSSTLCAAQIEVDSAGRYCYVSTPV